MPYFVLRNNTVEPFFPKTYSFSGYEDLSLVPGGADLCVWFYQAPVCADTANAANQVRGYGEAFRYLLGVLPSVVPVVALTMVCTYSANPVVGNSELAQAVADYNAMLLRESANRTNLKVVDFAAFTSQYPANELMDWKFYFMGQMALNPKLAKDFGHWWTRQLDSIALKRKKCLVLDLDNTLWGGVLGEEGTDGIKIGGAYPGSAYLFFQQVLLSLQQSGVVLTVCSKNNEADVLACWQNNPNLMLRQEHFVATRINWDDKATNIRSLAAELNIGLDSMVFVDDNPSERELVRQILPEVTVPEFPQQPYQLPEFARKLVEAYFSVYAVTTEDMDKTAQYRANAQRAEAQRGYADYDSYLTSLDLQLTIEPANAHTVARVAQMTQKTNQFNLTTHRYTEADIANFILQGGHVWTLGVADRFGNSGITGCLMLTDNRIDSLLLSCRVLGKGIEKAFVRWVLAALKAEGMRTVQADYVATAKNQQAANFYESLGFMLENQQSDGQKHYLANLDIINLEIERYYHINTK